MNDDEVLCTIKWTVADVRKAFEETYKRQPDDNELQEAIDSISWETVEDSSIENGWVHINTAIADIFNEEEEDD
jgi:hypothetical protein